VEIVTALLVFEIAEKKSRVDLRQGEPVAEAFSIVDTELIRVSSGH
jgi:hypothetical protein